MTRSQADSITKQGYLYKGPDTASDRMFAHIGSKSFKRRYCYLRQEVDGTYILELHKDEKQCEAKATIVMDFCTEVVQVRSFFQLFAFALLRIFEFLSPNFYSINNFHHFIHLGFEQIHSKQIIRIQNVGKIVSSFG